MLPAPPGNREARERSGSQWRLLWSCTRFGTLLAEGPAPKAKRQTSYAPPSFSAKSHLMAWLV